MPRPATPEEGEEFQRTSWFCRPENQLTIEEWIAGYERGDPEYAGARESNRRDLAASKEAIAG